MNNWNIIQDTDDDPSNEGSQIFNKYKASPANSNVPPAVPQRPPADAIHKTSDNLVKFLTISENVKSDPTLISYNSTTTSPRAPMRGPRDVPNDTNNQYKFAPTLPPRDSVAITPPPYPVEDVSSFEDDDPVVNLPVLPTPIEIQQYSTHQRIASSIMDSTGVSIQDEIDYFDLDSQKVEALPIIPLTPTRKVNKLEAAAAAAALPVLAPMTPKTTLEVSEEKPLPEIPSPKYEGEYAQVEEKPEILLPDLPFSASALRARHFKACGSASFLSNLWKWCSRLDEWFPNQKISLEELEKSFYSLFKFQIPELSEIFLEAISSDVIKTLIKNGNIKNVDLEESVEFCDVPVSGVYPNLKDCYSSMNHIFPTPYRCYSYCCTYERLNYTVSTHIQTGNMILGQDWVSHWKLTKEQLEDINRRVQIQQSHIFDAIKSVRGFINAGKILLEGFGEGFLKNKQFFGGEGTMNWDKFYEDAFGTVKVLINVTREFLFEPLVQKLNDEGKYIKGISEIVQKWLSEVQAPLLIYAEKRVPVHNLIKTESTLKNSKFTEWITRTNASVSRDYTSERLFSVTFLIFFTTLKVTLLAVFKKTDESDPEHRALAKVLKTLDILAQKSDAVQADAERKISVNNIKNKLLLKLKDDSVTLDLNDKSRVLFKVGVVIRKRDIIHRVLNDTPVVLILLDNYLLLADETADGKYKVTEPPIHLSYLFVESKRYDESGTPLVSRSPKRPAVASEVPESHSFRVRHYYKSMAYTFETAELEEKNNWLMELMRAKHAVNQNSAKFEPFKLSVIGDSLLGIDPNEVASYRQMIPANDNIMVALQDFDPELPRIESTSKILSFTRFKYNEKRYILLGTIRGLFMCTIGMPRGWRKILDAKNVSQVKVVEEFGLVFMLNDKVLTYYFLDAFMNNERLVGEKLSKRDVSFFKIGKQKNVTMVFFMKQRQSSSYFKVLIPILERSTQRVESFQEYKKFYIPGECSDITIFNSTVAVHTKRNFEIMSLSIAYPQPIPDLDSTPLDNHLQSSELDTLRKTLTAPGVKALGIYRLLNDKEFLVVYNKFAIFVNKSGRVSKDRMVKFSIKAVRSFFDKNLLILANDEFIEVWYINDTEAVSYQLVQVIAAQDLRLVCDDEGKGLFSMVHPEYPERQLLLALQPKY